eukprot:g65202.t1
MPVQGALVPPCPVAKAKALGDCLNEALSSDKKTVQNTISRYCTPSISPLTRTLPRHLVIDWVHGVGLCMRIDRPTPVALEIPRPQTLQNDCKSPLLICESIFAFSWGGNKSGLIMIKAQTTQCAHWTTLPHSNFL